MPTATESRTEIETALSRAVSDYLAFSRSAHLHASDQAWARKEEELWDQMMDLRTRLAEADAPEAAPAD